MGRNFEQTLFQRRYSDSQHKHEKIIINHQENANKIKKNNNEISPHIYKNSYYQKDKKEQAWTRIQRKGNP